MRVGEPVLLAFFFFLSTVKRQLTLLCETALFISKQKNEITFSYEA